jgi:hypothetical protein
MVTVSSPLQPMRRRILATEALPRWMLSVPSVRITAPPRLASSDARSTADVDFPAPPLGVRNTIVGMTVTTKFGMNGPENTPQLVEAQEDSESSQTVVRLPLDDR